MVEFLAGMQQLSAVMSGTALYEMESSCPSCGAHEINMSKHCTYCGRPRGAGEASRVVPIPVSFEGLRFLDDVFLP